MHTPRAERQNRQRRTGARLNAAGCHEARLQQGREESDSQISFSRSEGNPRRKESGDNDARDEEMPKDVVSTPETG